jgi:hypothetical protein
LQKGRTRAPIFFERGIMDRPEEEILTQVTYANVQLGSREFAIKPLTIRKSLTWRGSLSPILTTILSKPGALDDPATLREAILDSPEQMLNAVLGYLDLNEIDREFVLEHATEPQIRSAFGVLMVVAFYPIVDLRKLGPMLNPEIFEAKLASAQSSSLH